MKRKNIAIYIYSILLSISLLLTLEIGDSSIFPEAFINNFHFDILFFLKVIVLSVLIVLFTRFIFLMIDKVHIKEKKQLSNIYFVAIFIFLLLSGLLFLLTYYPVQNMNDTLYILYSPLGIANQHPLFYNLLIYIPFKVFLKLFGNMNLAFFLISFTQLSFMSLVITFILKWFNNTFKNNKLTIILSVYYIVTPIITNYNLVIIKDSIFSALLLMFLPLLYKIITSNGKCLNDKKYIILSIILYSCICLIRNNGIYILFLLILILVIKYKKYAKSILFMLIMIVIINKVPSFFVKSKSLLQEKVGIPIMQIAYTDYVNGNIDPESREYLDKWFNNSSIKDHYNPYTVDTIKWDPNFNYDYFNNNEKLFFSTYFKLLPKNFISYVKGYLLITYGNWSLDSFKYTQSRFLGLDDTDKNAMEHFPGLEHKRILPSSIQSVMTSFYETCTIFFSSGMCLWILLFILTYLVYIKKEDLILLAIPLVGNFATLMIASPLSVAFRYNNCYAYIIPILLFIVLIKKEEKRL